MKQRRERPPLQIIPILIRDHVVQVYLFGRRLDISPALQKRVSQIIVVAHQVTEVEMAPGSDNGVDEKYDKEPGYFLFRREGLGGWGVFARLPGRPWLSAPRMCGRLGFGDALWLS